MPPKPESTGEPRRSARVASKPPSTKAEKPTSTAKPASKSAKPASTKKRAAEEPEAAAPKSSSGKPPSKKAKPASSAKPKSSTKAAEEAEKKEEAPKEAEPEKGGSGKELQLGDVLPKLTLRDNNGGDVEISTLAKDNGVVFFLYPKANTPGCTNQACGYRDIYQEIKDAGYEVFGLSRDGEKAQDNWAKSKNFQYRLLCDPKSELIKKLGAFVAPSSTKRSHFIFEKGSGKLIDKQVGVKPADDPSNTLKFIKNYKA